MRHCRKSLRLIFEAAGLFYEYRGIILFLAVTFDIIYRLFSGE